MSSQPSQFPLRLLLTDGSGLTSRQIASQLHAAGHTVDAVAPAGLCLARLTRCVRRVHRVPAFGVDPYGWLEETLRLLAAERYDVLFPTHEQTALLALESNRVSALGVALAVPSFCDLRRVQDKVSATRTLEALGLPQPPTRIVTAARGLLDHREFPVFVKRAVGTASSGVQLVAGTSELARLAGTLERDRLGDEELLLQQPMSGQLVMVQSVFDRGKLVALHANRRDREGAGGGASHKSSLSHPVIRDQVRRLGAALRWHGPLSLDAIIDDDGPHYIDINPRLVEPGNGWRAGVDLVGAQVDVSLSRRSLPVLSGRERVRTHQLLLALLGAAQQGRGRRGVLAELLSAALAVGAYRSSSEELTPLRGDALAAVPAAAVAAALLVAPSAWHRFTSAAVASYALTPEAWQTIRLGRSDASGRSASVLDRPDSVRSSDFDKIRRTTVVDLPDSRGQ